MLGGFSDQVAELQNIKHKNVQDRGEENAGDLETSEFCNIFFIVWHSETIDFKCSRKACSYIQFKALVHFCQFCKGVHTIE